VAAAAKYYMTLIRTNSKHPVQSMAETGRKFSMKIRSDKEESKSDNENNETGNFMLIKSKESEANYVGDITITFHRPTRKQKNGSIMRKLLQLKHNQEDFNNPKSRD
jgi:hypothetical protein